MAGIDSVQMTDETGAPKSSSYFDYLRDKIQTMFKELQYKPWYIRFSVLDWRIRYSLLIIPIVLLILLIALLAYFSTGIICVDHTRNYRGDYSSTRSGLKCVQWSQLNRSIHTVTQDRYSSGGLAENFCRDPDGTGQLWCYTSLQFNHFDFCDLDVCAGASQNVTKYDTRYLPSTDTSCAPQVSLLYPGSRASSTYKMTAMWANGRGVYRKYPIIGGQDWCLAWHAEFRHWWITSCQTPGKNQGLAWLEEDARCPYDGRTWRRGGSDMRMSNVLVLPVTKNLINCVEYDVEYKGELVEDGVKASVNSEMCRLHCFNTTTCKAFTWNKNKRECRLWHVVEGKVDNSGSTSGSFTCSNKVKVGCPKDAVKIAGLCVRFLDSEAGICKDGCSRFRAMEECEETGGRLLEGVQETAVKELMDYVYNNHGYADWWTGGSDIMKKNKFVWEESGQEVPVNDRFWSSSSTPKNMTGLNGHACVYLARNTNGVKFDQVNCDTSLARPLCSYSFS